ncbi:MAG: hypothetical protein ACLGIA_04535 [Actinomycetes bacterium]
MSGGSGGQAALVTILVLTASVWVGGLVTLLVVARVATATLDPPQRVDFFRLLGRAYGPVASACLLVAFATGDLLLAGRPWGGLLTVTVVLGVALVLATAFGVAQARRMTWRRAAALAQRDDEAGVEDVRRGARRADVLRSVIALLTLALVVCAALLAVSS